MTPKPTRPPLLPRRWRPRFIALALLAGGTALIVPAGGLLVARTLGSAIVVRGGELLALGLAFGVGCACVVAAYWTIADMDGGA